VSEHDEFVALVQATIKSEQQTSPAPAAPPEPTTTNEPKAGAEAAGTGADSGNAQVAPVSTPETQKVDEKTVETTVQTQPEAPKTDWKAAAEQERQRQAQRQAKKQTDSALASENEALRAKLARHEAIEAKKQQNYLEAAKEAGFDYDQMTKEYLRTIDKQPDSPQNDELKAAIQKIHQLEAAFTSQQKALVAEQNRKSLLEFGAEINRIVEAKADAFELLKTAEEGPELVRAIVAARWNETAKYDSAGTLIAAGELMPTEDACKLAEDYFEQKQLKRFAQTKKFLALAKPPEVKKPDEKPVTTTLSNSMRQGGGDQIPTFGSETEELLAMIKKIEAQQGN